MDAFVQNREEEEEEEKRIVRHLLRVGVFFEAQKSRTSNGSLRDSRVLYHGDE